MSWLFGWLGGRGGEEAHRQHIRQRSFLGASGLAPTPVIGAARVPTGDYDLRIVQEDQQGEKAFGGGGQGRRRSGDVAAKQRCLVELKRATQALLKARCYPPPLARAMSQSTAPTAVPAAPSSTSASPTPATTRSADPSHASMALSSLSAATGAAAALKVREQLQHAEVQEQQQHQRRRRVIEGEETDPRVQEVLLALEQCLFLGLRRKAFHGVLPFWKLVWSAATGCHPPSSAAAASHASHSHPHTGGGIRGLGLLLSLGGGSDEHAHEEQEGTSQQEMEMEELCAVCETVLASGVVNNVVGRARAFVRVALNMKALESSLRALLKDHKELLEMFYKPQRSLLLCPEGSLILLALVATLQAFDFTLRPSHTLDTEPRYPLIDWAEEEEGGDRARPASASQAQVSAPASLVQSLEQGRLEDEAEARRLQQARRENPLLTFRERGDPHQGGAEEEEERLSRLIQQVGFGLDRLLLPSSSLSQQSHGASSRWEGGGGGVSSPPPPSPVAEGQGQPQEEPVTHVWGESLQRLCADAKASPHARLEPRLAVPCAYQEMLDALMTPEAIETPHLFDPDWVSAADVAHVLDLVNRGGHLPPHVGMEGGSSSQTALRAQQEAHARAVSVALIEFLDALPEPLLGWGVYDEVMETWAAASVPAVVMEEEEEGSAATDTVLPFDAPPPAGAGAGAAAGGGEGKEPAPVSSGPYTPITDQEEQPAAAAAAREGKEKEPSPPSSPLQTTTPLPHQEEEEEPPPVPPSSPPTTTTSATTSSSTHRRSSRRSTAASRHADDPRFPRLRRLLLERVPAAHQPLLSRLTLLLKTLAQAGAAGLNGLSPRSLAEATVRGLIRTPYLPDALASRPELARLLVNEEEVALVQALIERRDALLPELDAELARHQSALDRKWGRLQALRRKMGADPTASLEGLPGHAAPAQQLMQELASRLDGVEAALRRVRFVSADDFPSSTGMKKTASASSSASIPPSVDNEEEEAEEVGALAYLTHPDGASRASGVRDDILELLENVPRANKAMADADVRARLSACGFPGGDLRGFAEGGGGLLAPECLLHFFARFPQHASLMLFKYARRPPQAGGLAFPRLVSAVTGAVMAALHLTVSPEHLLLHMALAPWWNLLSEETAVPELFCLAMVTLDFIARHEAVRPHDEEAYVLEVKRQLSWVLRQGPPNVPSAWRAWIGVRLEQQKLFASQRMAMHQQHQQHLKSPTPSPPPSQTPPSSVTGPTSTSTTTPAAAPTPAPPRLVNGPSQILTEEHTLALEGALPEHWQDYAWRRLYSLSGDGASLTTFFRKARRREPTLLVLKAMEGGQVFGGFASKAWVDKGEVYYGDGESFVWAFLPSSNQDQDQAAENDDASMKLEAFKWSTDNSYFQLSNTRDGIAMGGGGSFALLVDPELLNGSSGACETFGCPHSLLSPTAASSSFTVLDLELWTLEADFLPPTTLVEAGANASEVVGTVGVVAAEKARGAEDIERADRGRGW